MMWRALWWTRWRGCAAFGAHLLIAAGLHLGMLAGAVCAAAGSATVAVVRAAIE
ncbi:MAG: hypothetical protein ACLPGW_05760 [Roseiarcus sp.]